MGKRRMVAPLLAAAAAATIALPAAPAKAADTCHPPNYDTVYCACVIVGRIFVTVVPDSQWACARP